MRDYEVKQKEVEQVKNKYKTSYIASCDLEIARSDSPDLGNLLKDKKKKKKRITSSPAFRVCIETWYVVCSNRNND